jgi:hypothetical protein
MVHLSKQAAVVAFCISDGPESPVVDKHFPAKFRISYRAGNELNICIYD